MRILSMIPLFVLMILGNCGQHPDNMPASPTPVVSISTVDRYIVQFFDDMKSRGLKLDKSLIQEVRLVDIINDNPMVKGYCTGDSKHQVLLFRGDLLDNEAKVAVYHELGHCMLGEQHTDNSKDIMYKYLTYEPLIAWTESVDTLFNTRDKGYVAYTKVSD